MIRNRLWAIVLKKSDHTTCLDSQAMLSDLQGLWCLVDEVVPYRFGSVSVGLWTTRARDMRRSNNDNLDFSPHSYPMISASGSNRSDCRCVWWFLDSLWDRSDGWNGKTTTLLDDRAVLLVDAPSDERWRVGCGQNMVEMCRRICRSELCHDKKPSWVLFFV